MPPTSGSAEAGAPSGPAPSFKPFDRYVYHRFPEINQDLLEELNERGMPKRRDADPAIRIAYIDASKLQVYLDEQPAATADAAQFAPLRVIIRLPAGKVRVVENVAPGGTIADLMPGLDIHLLDRWAHAEQVERPKVVAEKDRRKDEIGTHGNAMLAVQVNAKVGGTDWSHIIWLPFTKYLTSGLNTERSLDLPDGRKLTLAFGRIRHPLPGFLIQLRNFNMIAYDHRGAPRDYQSELEVVPTHNGEGPLPFKPYIHLASLNAPLQAPFHWDDSRSWFANAFGTLASRLSPRQFKFSQAGWDQQTWAQTQQLVDEGKLPRPYVQFTILGVGNNPGIHVIALGAILMSVGIPWAFYIKPLILKRRRDKLKAAHVPRIAAQQRAVPITVDSQLNGSPVTHSPDSVGVRR